MCVLLIFSLRLWCHITTGEMPVCPSKLFPIQLTKTLCKGHTLQCSIQTSHQIWCDFDRASSLICGNKMPTRCNRGLYCRSYCLLNMFRASPCPSSEAQEYYTVVAACGIWCCGFSCSHKTGPVNQHPANRTHNPQLHTRPATWKKHNTKYHTQQPLYNTLELLMMGIMMPETCWARNKICNKNLCCI